MNKSFRKKKFMAWRGSKIQFFTLSEEGKINPWPENELTIINLIIWKSRMLILTFNVSEKKKLWNSFSLIIKLIKDEFKVFSILKHCKSSGVAWYSERERIKSTSFQLYRAQF